MDYYLGSYCRYRKVVHDHKRYHLLIFPEILFCFEGNINNSCMITVDNNMFISAECQNNPS